MKQAQEYNDLWTIIENMPPREAGMLPEKFLNFVEAAMLPGAKPRVRTDLPLEEQQLPGEVKNLLASVYLTYWAKSASDRREFADGLHRSELRFRGEPSRPMTDEEYQDLLGAFDDWHFWFGRIPFWAESRGWCPKRCYELTTEGRAELTVGNTFLREAAVTPEQRAQVLGEAKQWVVEAVSEHEEELYWHGNDISRWKSTRLFEEFYTDRVVVKDGHFIGALIGTEQVSASGLSTYKSGNIGLLFTDGSSDGETESHYFRNGDETSESCDTVYSLRRREE